MDIAKIFSALLYFILGIVEVLLGFRFVLLLFGANSDAGFTEWVYSSTEPLVGPFVGVFPSFDLANVITIELGTLLAIIVYAVFAVVIVQLIKAFEGFVVKPTGPKSGAISNAMNQGGNPQTPQQQTQQPQMPMQNQTPQNQNMMGQPQQMNNQMMQDNSQSMPTEQGQ